METLINQSTNRSQNEVGLSSPAKAVGSIITVLFLYFIVCFVHWIDVGTSFDCKIQLVEVSNQSGVIEGENVSKLKVKITHDPTYIFLFDDNWQKYIYASNKRINGLKKGTFYKVQIEPILTSSLEFWQWIYSDYVYEVKTLKEIKAANANKTDELTEGTKWIFSVVGLFLVSLILTAIFGGLSFPKSTNESYWVYQINPVFLWIRMILMVLVVIVFIESFSYWWSHLLFIFYYGVRMAAVFYTRNNTLYVDHQKLTLKKGTLVLEEINLSDFNTVELVGNQFTFKGVESKTKKVSLDGLWPFNLNHNDKIIKKVKEQLTKVGIQIQAPTEITN